MAKKKNAPVLKNNLRNVPAEKFRAVNRMNGIVTMVEYSSEDDIKAYEIEPTFRELGGGGGGNSFLNPILTCTLILTEGDVTMPYIGYEDNNVTNHLGFGIAGGGTRTLRVLVPYDDMFGEGYKWKFYELCDDPRTKTVTNEINCSVEIDDDIAYAIVTDPTQPASFTLTLS